MLDTPSGYVLVDLDDSDSVFSLDLPVAFTGQFLPSVYRNKTLFWIGEVDGHYISGGEATVDSNGSVSGVNSVDFDNVIIGFPF